MTADAPFLHTYGRYPLTLVRGEGRRVQDADGRWFLDAICGISVTSLGHGHPRVLAAVQAQVDALWHTSNLYHVPVQTQFATTLCRLMGGHGVFLCNSGTEANEAAVKLVRKHHWRTEGQPDVVARNEILVLENAFHGRSLMSLAMTPRAAYQQGFGPLPGGVQVATVDTIASRVGPQTAAVFVEPVQGEGGCRPVPEATLLALRAACDRHGALLVYDEIQCGLGRTGVLQHSPRPDLITLAKTLGGGFPLGALLVVNPALLGALGPGDHGTTFGGNPVACAAGLATLDAIEQDGLADRCATLGARLRSRLEAAGATVRGRGLMLGVVTGGPPGDVIARMREEHGVLACAAGGDAVRLLPAFTSTEAEIDVIADAVLASIATEASAS